MRGKEKIKWSNSSKKELNLLHSQSYWWGCLGCSQLCRKNEWMNKLTNGCRMCVSCCTPFSVSGALYFMGKFNCFWPGRELTSPQSPALHKSALHINIRTCHSVSWCHAALRGGKAARCHSGKCQVPNGRAEYRDYALHRLFSQRGRCMRNKAPFLSMSLCLAVYLVNK